MYHVQEFADLAGVTVRALHHYDELGLLKPLRKARTGYRVYRDTDFARLEQIAVLKFLGVPLREIAPLLKKSNAADLRDVVRRQRRVLIERRQQIDAAIRAIQKAERALDSNEPDWRAFTLVVKEIETQNDRTWTKKYYSESAQAKVEARRAMWTPELQELVTAQWKRLVCDIETALARQVDPKSVAAQVLAARWDDLIAGFTGGDPDIQEGLNKMWADRDNWPAGKASGFRMPPEVAEFVATARRHAGLPPCS